MCRSSSRTVGSNCLRRLRLCIQTGESREIYHFHYTTWPDFGVPESPAAFLNFLLKVRDSGSLGPEHGPSVVHCSAGIGRSGTFSLVDTCLVLVRGTRNQIIRSAADTDTETDGVTRGWGTRQM